MAVAASVVWEFNASATANMVNGGGFDYLTTGNIADGSFASANTSAPTLSSATYTFVAGDANNWVYITDTTYPGYYKISSVSTGIATLDATLGSGIELNTTTNRWNATTHTGVDSSATPSSKHFSVDYSQVTAAVVNGLTDFGAVGGSSTLTSASAPFTPAMVGNIYHQTTTGTGGFGTVGWYQITGYTNTTTVTLDRAPNGGTASVGCTGYIGGALSLNSTLDDDFYEQIQAGNTIFFKSGNYTLGEGISIASTNSTGTNPSNTIGYKTLRGDTCTGSDRPVIACGANAWAAGQFQNFQNLILTTTATTGMQLSIGSRASNIKVLNSSTTADRAAYSSGTDGLSFDIETVCQLGRGLYFVNSNHRHFGCSGHNSKVGIYNASSRNSITDCLSYANSSTGITNTNTTFHANNCTLAGFATPRNSSAGVSISASVTNTYITNSIIWGWVTGIAGTTAQQYSNRGAYNNFYNNTSNASLYNIDVTDTTLDPAFTTVTELTGSTATTSGSVLTQSGGDFSTVTDNTDYIYIVSGTGITAGMYLITSHTSTTVTLNNAPGTNATADKVWIINTGRNYSVGTNMKAVAFPGAYAGSTTTSYKDLGGVQRVEGSGSSGGSYVFG